jgi:hypothetical protein
MVTKMIKTLLALALLSVASYADDDVKNIDRVIDEPDYLKNATPEIHLSGYVDAGYIYNFTGVDGPQSSYHGSDNGGGGDFNLNAFKVVLEKALSDKNEFQAGFRVDIMLGEDAGALTTGTGTAGSSDNLYLQQAHILLRLPVGHGLKLQVGKFGSILGFEADERPANLNITQGFNALLDPAPSTGLLATYPLNDRLKLIGGLINGSGLDTNNGLDQNRDGYALTGGLGLTNEKGNAESQVAYHYAPMGDSGIGTQAENESLLGLNWWGTWAPMFGSDKLLLAFNASYWMANDFNAPAADPAADDASNYWVGALYAKYQFTELFSLAGRGEYAHSDDNNLLALAGRDPSLGDDLFSWTLTAGFNLSEELLFRMEYRADAGSSVVADPTGTFSNQVAHRASAQIVYSF